MDTVGWLSGKYNSKNVGPVSSQPTTRLEMEKPASMPQPEFSAMKKGEKRKLPHRYDKIINIEGRPILHIGFSQSKYKVSDHGAVHGLPYIMKDNGGTKTEKNDKTALAMMKSIQNMPHRPNIIWFDQDDATYQGGTEKEIPAVHLFDDDTDVIAVFNKQTGNFVTTCQLTLN